MNSRMGIVDLLTQARKMYAEHPAQNDLAVDDQGRGVPVSSVRAVAYCAMGAIAVTASSHGASVNTMFGAYHALRDASLALYGKTASEINDEGSLLDAMPKILSAYDKAIADVVDAHDAEGA